MNEEYNEENILQVSSEGRYIGVIGFFLIVFLISLVTYQDKIVKTETTIGEIVAIKEEDNSILPADNIILVRIDGKIQNITKPTDEEVLMCKGHEGEKAKIKIRTQRNKKEILSVLDVGNNIEDNKE